MDKIVKTIRRTAHTASSLRIREREGGGESRAITGYAILFDTPSVALYSDGTEEVREVIAPEAVTMELLDGSDIKMTMFHNRELILARSNQGRGTLTYGVDATGVWFEFEAPETADGDKALELVRRGDLAGCSFAFSTQYYDRSYVSVDTERVEGRTLTTYTVRVMTGIYDFTLAADPAYPDTTVEAEQRELFAALAREAQTEPEPESEPEPQKPSEVSLEQVREMRRRANTRIF